MKIFLAQYIFNNKYQIYQLNHHNKLNQFGTFTTIGTLIRCHWQKQYSVYNLEQNLIDFTHHDEFICHGEQHSAGENSLDAVEGKVSTVGISRVCMFSSLPPTVKRHACEVNWLFCIGCVCECEHAWLSVSVLALFKMYDVSWPCTDTEGEWRHFISSFLD